MRKSTAAAGSALFFAIAPGVVAGLVPWWLTGWRVRGPLTHWATVRVTGLVMLVAGAIVLIDAFARFVAEGHGTPAPAAPAGHLVIGGLYRYVRNPMYWRSWPPSPGRHSRWASPYCSSMPPLYGLPPPHSPTGTKNQPWPANSARNTGHTAAASQPGGHEPGHGSRARSMAMARPSRDAAAQPGVPPHGSGRVFPAPVTKPNRAASPAGQ